MSIESTQERMAGDAQQSAPKAERSPVKPASPYPADVKNPSVSANGETPAMDLPIKPTRNLPVWLLYNLVVPFVLLGVAAAVVVGLGTDESPSRPPIDDTMAGRLFALPAVDVAAVRSLESTGQKLQLTTDGTVVPYREIVLATEVAGQIVEKSAKCEAGKFVKQGDMLMVIDPTDYELEVKRLRRLQQQEYEALAEIDQEMANTDKSKELAMADIELQQRELQRRQALPDQFASQGELDQARRALLQAEQQLLQLQNQMELAKKRRIRLQSAEQLAKMQLEAAENNLKRTRIEAPMDGVIVSEQAELNTFVARGSAVVTMEDTSKVEVAASLRTDQLYWVLNQNRSEDLVLAQPDGTQVRGYQLPPTPVQVRYQLSGRDDLTYQWRGQLIGYDGIGLDETTRTVPVRIVVDHPQQFIVKRNGKVIGTHGEANVAGPTTLVRGMFVNLSLELSPAMDLVVLPSESLKPGNRVWQFIPDASVLDVSLDLETLVSQAEVAEKVESGEASINVEAPVKELVPAVTADDEKALADALAEKGFDPTKWVPGKLQIVQDVRPVDRFVPESAPDAFIDNESEPQFWICEVPKMNDPNHNDSGHILGNGSYVIVSPLGSLQSNTLPVRASSDIVERSENGRSENGSSSDIQAGEPQL
ncbi:efflux RND transporter periplasmic adaptor subunit [Neorhodopirellula pilleata]|uniref:Multidrug resistance protein MdtN n=1 Tax=Neorhodopirellula pilleata TaxID=2714738 RepID=A0A5C6A498_9BACT|nr:HlyD family efflux transporter periplasmic adaptor subunit [Neorhodopirellula pilleata]TWT94205.1 Multidrug resistance protein MdtN [Neorhodopirellula pilleata]